MTLTRWPVDCWFNTTVLAVGSNPKGSQVTQLTQVEAKGPMDCWFKARVHRYGLLRCVLWEKNTGSKLNFKTAPFGVDLLVPCTLASTQWSICPGCYPVTCVSSGFEPVTHVPSSFPPGYCGPCLKLSGSQGPRLRTSNPWALWLWLSDPWVLWLRPRNLWVSQLRLSKPLGPRLQTSNLHADISWLSTCPWLPRSE